MLWLFFRYRQALETYYECRLWEVPRERWRYYYGSPYNSTHRRALKRTLQPERYRVVFQDKALCAMLCSAIGARCPVTYGVIKPTDRYPEMLAAWCMASPDHSLFLKPLVGRGGSGVALVRERRGSLSVSSRHATVDLKKYCLESAMLVQEVVRQEPRLAAFAPASLNTLRVVTLLTKASEVVIVNAQLRFGVGDSFVDNFSAGGVCVRVDVDSGKLVLPGRDKANRLHTSHPTSGRSFDFSIPNWRGIVSFAHRIQTAFDFYRLLGLDIALDSAGEPTLIEINASPDIDGAVTGPLLSDERILRVFGEYDLLVNPPQRRLYRELLAKGRR